VAWCALECLVDRAIDGAVEASVRSIAGDLGVAKNTAHRAISTLVRAGLVEPVQGRGRDGRFGIGRYRLRVEGLFTGPSPTPKLSPQRKTAVAPDQLSLIP
jgi:DNA-binding IclR family transcriptional regulator